MRHPLHIIFVFLFFSQLSAFSQSMVIKNYSNQRELTMGSISVFQDTKGWMWFTNGYDVIRYDGFQFKTLRPAEGFHPNHAYHIIEVDHEIWVFYGTHMGRVKNDIVYPVWEHNHKFFIRSFLQTHQEKYFVNLDGLYRLRENKMQLFIPIIGEDLASDAQLVALNDSILLTYDHRKDMLLFDVSSATCHRFPISIEELKKDVHGNMYMLQSDVGVIKINTIKKEGGKYLFDTVNILPFYGENYERFSISNNGNLFLSKRNEHIRIVTPGKKDQIYGLKEGLPSLLFGELFTDRENNTWVGLTGGLSKFVQSPIQSISDHDSLFSKETNSIIANRPHQIFVRTSLGLNVITDKDVKRVRTEKGQVFTYSFLLTDSLSNQIYYTNQNKLFHAVLDTQDYRIKKVQILDTLPNYPVSINRDKWGNIIVVTAQEISWYKNDALVPLVKNPVVESAFKLVYIDGKNRLWAGDFGGPLSCYQIERTNEGGIEGRFLFTIENSDRDEKKLYAARAMAEAPNGHLYIGTRYNGLFVVEVKNNKPTIKKHISIREGLASNAIWDLAFASNGECWMANGAGLFSVGDAKTNWRVRDEGKSTEIYALGQIEIIQDKAWIDNYPGVSIVEVDKQIPTYPFQVAFTDVMVNGNPILNFENKKLAFSHTQNNLQINFSANTFYNEDAVLYSYILQGSAQSNWSVANTGHSLHFSSLSPGKYQLMVRAIHPNGTLSTNVAILHFNILLPLWKNAWFIALVALCMAAVIYYFIKLRANKRREVIAVQQQISRDLHDEIGSTLTSISILSKVSKNNLDKDNEKAGSMLQKVIEQAEQMQQSISDIVWAIRPENEQISSLIARLREYMSHTLEPKNIDIQISVEKQMLSKSLSMRQRKELLLIFKEAINNMAKYSQANLAEVSITEKENKIQIQIFDNGMGIGSSKTSRGNGLKNMEERTLLMGGKFTIQSPPEGGTRIVITIPAT